LQFFDFLNGFQSIGGLTDNPKSGFPFQNRTNEAAERLKVIALKSLRSGY